MYESIKVTKRAKLIIDFMDELVEKGPHSLIILNQSQLISKDKTRYEFELEDKSVNENKVYECFLEYESEKVPYYLKVTYGIDNYYYFGRKKNNMSMEFIFFDFKYKNIDNDRCYIKYNGIKYYAENNKSYKKLRNLNLINIDLNLLELPLSYKNKAISANYFDDRSYSVAISVAEKTPKIFSIFLNKPFLERKFELTPKEITTKLEESLNKVQNVLNYSADKTYLQYRDGIDNEKISSIYVTELRNSIKLEEKIFHFFDVYRPNLTEEELQALEAYSEFIITFPDFLSKKRNDKIIASYPFYKQHYYSHKAIENFMKTIPTTLNKTERAYLKYSACRCLRALLLNDIAISEENLFYFCDLNKEGTLYNEAKKFNETFINELTEDSEMYLFLIQINSGSSINKLTNVLTAKFSMLTIDQIKEHLRYSLPNYIIRVKSYTSFKGLTLNEAKCTIISEIDIFGHFLDDEILSNRDLDYNYNKRLILSNVLQHERFGHFKFSLNFYSFHPDKGILSNNSDTFDNEPLSPRQYYRIINEGNEIKEQLAEIVETIESKSGENIEIGESGYAFNIFLTRGDSINFNILRDNEADFTKVFKEPKLFASDDLTALNSLIRDSLPKSKLPENKPKKNPELKGKYEYSRKKFIYRDCIPTIAKYSC